MNDDIENGDFVHHPEYGYGWVNESGLVLAEDSRGRSITFGYSNVVKVGNTYPTVQYGPVKVTSKDVCKVFFDGYDTVQCLEGELRRIPLAEILKKLSSTDLASECSHDDEVVWMELTERYRSTCKKCARVEFRGKTEVD